MAFLEPTPLVKYDLGSSGAGWVRKSLTEGAALAMLLSRRTDFADGTVFTFAPEGVDDRRLKRFEEGGLIRGTAALDTLALQLQQALRPDARYLIAENAQARPSDQFLRILEGARFSIHDSVYEIAAPQSTTSSIRDCLRRADAGYTLNAVVSSLSRPPGQLEDLEFLAEVVKKTFIVIVRAYDGESFVCWERSGVMPTADVNIP
jgi:hypothetical protein